MYTQIRKIELVRSVCDLRLNMRTHAHFFQIRFLKLRKVKRCEMLILNYLGEILQNMLISCVFAGKWLCRLKYAIFKGVKFA